MFIGFVLIKYFDYDAINAIVVGISVLYFAGILSIRESPVWYTLKGKREDAVKANFYYKGKMDEVTEINNGGTKDQVRTFSFRDFCKFTIF